MSTPGGTPECFSDGHAEHRHHPSAETPTRRLVAVAAPFLRQSSVIEGHEHP
jgi:hypothetical protein